jgi:hypothetical protein
MSTNIDTNLLCLPVTREGNRYVWDSSHPAGLDELPKYRTLKTYIERHYRRVDSYVEWKGLTFKSAIFEPRDVNDLTYALVDSSTFDSSVTPDITVDSAFVERTKTWVSQHLDYSERGPWGGTTRLLNEFVDPTLEVWDHAEGPTGQHMSLRELMGRGRVVVMGGPGIGKTTCLRKIAIVEAARNKEDPLQRVPVYIQLRQVAEHFEVLSAIQKALKDQTGIDVTEDLESLIQSGRLLLLLDGLDEVHERMQSQFVAEILQTARRFPLLGIYLSTRQWEYHWRFPGFLHVQIQPFSMAQIEEWIFRRLPKSDLKVARHLIFACKSDQEIANVSSLPIMLALIAGLFEQTGKIPRRRSDIIARFLDTVLETWDTIRDIRRSDDEALKEDKIELLCRFAAHSWEESRLTFREDELIKLENDWSDLLPTRTHRSLLRDSGIFTYHHGSIKTWSFTHQVFRDYLAAQFLIARPDNVLENVLGQKSDDRDLFLWRHACSLTSDASPLLRVLMENESLPDYQRARWLAQVLADGTNVPKELEHKVVKVILDKIDAASQVLTVVRFSQERDRWQLVVAAEGSEDTLFLKSVIELLQTVLGTGWTSLHTHLFSEAKQDDPSLVKIIKTLSETEWIINTGVDEDSRNAVLLGTSLQKS